MDADPTPSKLTTDPSSSLSSGKFRKKPIVVEAMRFDGTNAILDWAATTGPSPLWGHDFRFQPSTSTLFILTKEGEMRAEVGDWIICGVKGEFYPCKPYIFEATYEPVESSDPSSSLSALAKQTAKDALLSIWGETDYKYSDEFDRDTTSMCETILSALEQAFTEGRRTAQQEIDELERELRELWWAGHGCVTSLYGDDGEMQCNRHMIDFKRMPLNELRERVRALKWEQLKEPSYREAEIQRLTRERAAQIAENHIGDLRTRQEIAEAIRSFHGDDGEKR